VDTIELEKEGKGDEPKERIINALYNRVAELRSSIE
jgi:hypothetical protein